MITTNDPVSSSEKGEEGDSNTRKQQQQQKQPEQYKIRDKNIGGNGFSLAGATIEFVELQCHRCDYRWTYSGRNMYKATCPHCSTSIAVQKFLKVEYEKKKQEDDRRRFSELAKILADEIVQKLRNAEIEKAKG
jgi:hypothetical protein